MRAGSCASSGTSQRVGREERPRRPSCRRRRARHALRKRVATLVVVPPTVDSSIDSRCRARVEARVFPGLAGSFAGTRFLNAHEGE
jgi:hypothetical protein